MYILCPLSQYKWDWFLKSKPNTMFAKAFSTHLWECALHIHLLLPRSPCHTSHFPPPSFRHSLPSLFNVTPYVSVGFSTWLWAPGRAETSFCYFLHLCTKQARLLGASGGQSMPFLLTTPFLIEKRLREGVAAWSFIQKLEMGWTSCEIESEPFRRQAHGDLCTDISPCAPLKQSWTCVRTVMVCYL